MDFHPLGEQERWIRFHLAALKLSGLLPHGSCGCLLVKSCWKLVCQRSDNVHLERHASYHLHRSAGAPYGSYQTRPSQRFNWILERIDQPWRRFMSLLPKGTDLGQICNFFFFIYDFYIFTEHPQHSKPLQKWGGKKTYTFCLRRKFEHQITRASYINVTLILYISWAI